MSGVTRRLSDRVIVVTGAASGIGTAIAERIVAEGGRAMLLDRREAALADVARGLEAATGHFRCDVTCATSVEAAMAATLQRFGRVDGLVHGAAARSVAGSVLTLDLAQWHRELDVSLTGAFLCSKHALPHMIAAGSGSTVFISSVYGQVAVREAVAYCAAKAGLVNLAKAIAIDHAAQGIRANCISPGPVASDAALDRWHNVEAANAALGPGTLLGRISQPAEIAAAVAFLLSDDASYVTGADMLVDGGFAAR